MGSRSRPRQADKLPDQETLRVATVNVGSLNERENEVVETITRRKIDICCLQETNLAESGARIITGKDSEYKLFWAGNKDGIKGVGILIAEKWINKVIQVIRPSDRLLILKILVGKKVLTIVSPYAPQQGLNEEAKDLFYASLTEHVSKIEEKDMLIIAGDLNGHVGKSTSGYSNVHGGFGYGTRNPEGERILEFCLALDLVVCNTMFKKPDNKLITFSSGGNQTQIDYILVRPSDKKMVRDVKVIPGEEAFTQHRLVVCDLTVKMEHSKKKPFVPQLKVWKLKEESVRTEFAHEFQKQHTTVINPTNPVEEGWTGIKQAYLNTTEKVCGRTKKPTKRKVTWWWSKKVDEAVKEKRRLWKEWKKGNCSKDQYNVAKEFAKRTVRVAKAAAEAKKFGDLSTSNDCRNNAFRIAKQIKDQNKDVMGDTCVKNDKGQLAFSDEDKLLVWNKHYQTLLNEEFPWDATHLDQDSPKEGPPPRLTKEQVQNALKKMKDGKAAGGSGIVAEMIKASGEKGLEAITDLFNNIIQGNTIPSDWDKSIIKNCFKGKGDAMVCGNYRGLKLLEHAMKLFERVMETVIRDSVDIDSMQFGFMPGRGTIDAIFITRQIQEKYLAKKKDLYFAFVDLEKAFDRVPRKVVEWALRKAGVEEWIVRVVMSMYRNCQTAVNVNGTTGEPFDIKVGVHQGSVLSPLLFIIVMEALSKDLRKGLPWELLYADDLVLIAESVKELEEKYKAWKTGMLKKGLR